MMQIYINYINTFGPAADHQHEEEEANLHISRAWSLGLSPSLDYHLWLT